MNHWQSDVLVINGQRRHYTRTGGDKPPVVLAHGFSEDGLVWTALAQVLEDRYDVIMPDARGHGQSDTAETDLSPATLASDLVGIIRALGLSKPAILGHSMGGMTTLAVAGLYPDIPGAIVIEDGMPFEMNPASTASEGATDGLRAYFTAIAGKNHEELMAWRRVQSPNWSETDVQTFADAKIRLDPHTLAPYMNRGAAVPPARTSPPVDWPTLLHQIRCPALLITGDPALGAIVTAQQAALLQTQVATLRVASIADATHDVRRDQAEAFLALISPFLTRWASDRE